jgi:hypothetical protein
VARGGSYYQAAYSNRSTNRQLPEASLRDLTVGMRVCVTPRRNRAAAPSLRADVALP